MTGKLRSREIGDAGSHPHAFKRTCSRQRFTFHLPSTIQHDSHDPDTANLKLSFLRRRSKIVEIISAGDLVFALTLSGVCAVFRGSQRVGFLNIKPDEVIRSLFFNKQSQSLITVSVYRADNFSSLKCRDTHIEYIRRGRMDAGFPIFESECLRYPGFVEFDDVNCKVLTYSAPDQAYRIWSMTNYELLFTLPGESITEVKISPGIMLCIHARKGSYVPLRIVSIEDGTVLKDFNQLLLRAKKVDFIEQFNEKLLVKQEGENLSIVDVHTGDVVEVSQTEFVTPNAFIFLYENNLFLTFRQRQVTAWNFKGEQVTTFDDHTLWHPDTNTNNIFITAAQDYIISFCKADRIEGGPTRGSVNVSHILTGKCVAKVYEPQASSDEREHGSSQSLGTDDSDEESLFTRGSVGAGRRGFGEVTALHFSEERNELYVGNKQGILHIWSQ